MSEIAAANWFRPRLARRKWWGRVFAGLCLAAALGSVAVLAVLLIQVAAEGLSLVNRQFLTRFPSVLFPEKAGIKSALWGTLWLAGLTAGIGVPLGVGAAVYLQEYAGRNRLTRWIELNIANLAGVPSIVYGILGLAVFVRWLHLGRSVLSGGLTMSLLTLPVIIIATREALAAVPNSIREAGYALGATRWQVVRDHVLPAALPGILTGVILALSRAVGEAAPLILIGALAFVAFVPQGPLDAFTVLPIQIYDWTDRPQPEFHRLAAAAIIVLLVVLFMMNLVCVLLRAWQQRKRLA
jgi:phosphate transport system permease protein